MKVNIILGVKSGFQNFGCSLKFLKWYTWQILEHT